ncbi:MAG: V-type ATP synthase subunit F [Candidatus Micrarchaeia archaeon]
MSYKIAILGNELLCTGFGLAGVSETYVMASGEDAQTMLKELMSRQDIGIIGIGSGIMNGIKDKELKRKIENSSLPIVVELPEYGEEIAEDVLRKLIIRAVGIDLELGAGKGD